MSYLARLKQLESGEIFHHTPKPEPTKPTKGASDGFVGSIPGVYENIHAENDADETEKGIDGKHRRWLVHFADRDPVEVYCDPHETHAGILKCYPNALAVEPLPERIPKVFTEAENAEWEALWLGDDDRITCTQCANLRGRVCTVAGGPVNALKGYMPILEILRRCEGYVPLKTTMEQRVTHCRIGTNQVTTND